MGTGAVGSDSADALVQAVGSCFNFVTTCCLFFAILYTSSTIIVLPIANGQITTITALYGEAERALDSLIAVSGKMPQTTERRDVISMLQSHATVLQTFKEADRLRARFLGFPVTWAVVKTFYVTLFTLGIGLWSVLRGVGVTFTLQSVCPLK